MPSPTPLLRAAAAAVLHKKEEPQAQLLNHFHTVQKARLAENLLGSFVFPGLRGSAGTCSGEISTLSGLEMLNRAEDICIRGLPLPLSS